MTSRQMGWTTCFLASLVMWAGIMFVVKGCNMAVLAEDRSGGTIEVKTTYTIDQYCDAIFKAEGSYSATWLYGIRSVNYEDEAEAREICLRTVYNTLVKHRDERCRPEWGETYCIANRYCPVDGELDDGRCKYWQKNVEWFLENKD